MGRGLLATTSRRVNGKLALGYYIMDSEWVGDSGRLHHGEWMGMGLWATTSWRVNGYVALDKYIIKRALATTSWRVNG
jgi:hypothetical protein